VKRDTVLSIIITTTIALAFGYLLGRFVAICKDSDDKWKSEI